MKPICEEYYNRYIEIKANLIKAYIDKFSLRVFGKYNKTLSENENAIMMGQFCFQHMCELLKSDFALTVWKVFLDNSSDANTIRCLNRFLHAEYGGSKKIKIKNIKISTAWPSLEEKIKKFRNSYLSHIQSNRQLDSIEIADLENLLDAVKDILNELCYPEIDHRVSEITDQEISTAQLKVELSLGYVVNNSIIKQT